jgi:hypothetical protein
MSASTAATYIFIAPNCTTTIIGIEPRALNAGFQRFVLRFNKMSLLLPIPLKWGIGGERKLKDRVTFRITLIYFKNTLKNATLT